MVSWLRPRHSAVLFDVGAAGIRAQQFRWTAGGLRWCDGLHLDALAKGERPDLATGDDPAGDDARGGSAPPAPGLAPPRVEPARIKRLIGQARFRGAGVGLVLSPPDVRFFPMSLPARALAQSSARVEQAVQWEVGRASREDPNSLEVRYWLLPRGNAQSNVMAVVIPARTAQVWCEAFARERLDLRRIDVSPCALVRLARSVHRPAETDIWGVLDLGLRHTTLTVVVGQTPTYIRSLSGCAHDWTTQLARVFEVSVPIAEQLKRDYGVASAAGGTGGGGAARDPLHAADLPAACASVLRDALRRLTTEVERCFAYVMQGFPEHSVHSLLLAGGGARLKGLPELLSQELGVSVSVLGHSPAGECAPRALPPDRVGPSVAAAMGAALLDLENA